MCSSSSVRRSPLCPSSEASPPGPTGRLPFTKSGQSFIRNPDGLPLAEAGFYREEMITAVLDLEQADRRYALDSLNAPLFLRPYWQKMLKAVRARAGKNSTKIY
jgi:hypothetical protein